MKTSNKVSIYFIVALVFLGSLQGNNQPTHNTPNAHTRSTEEDIFSIIDYLSLFTQAHEQYLQKNNVEPKITCHKCSDKLLDLGEFCGSLVGIALKDMVNGKNNFNETKTILDGCLNVIFSGSCSDIINYMIRISNETKQACPGCCGQSESWGL